METWKPVIGYEGLYEVSDLGRVRSVNILKPERIKGYLRIALRKESCGKQKKFFVHCLVMRAFVGPPPPGKEVNHKFGIRPDNRLTELEYATKQENQIHARDILKRKYVCGSLHGRSKLTEEEVLEIRALRGKWPMKLVAEHYRINIPSVSLIWNRRIWKHI